MAITHHSPTAVAFAQSLLELGVEGGKEQAIGDQLASLRQVVDDNPLLGRFFADPAIGRDERAAVIDRSFKGQLDQLVFNFVRLLNHKGKLGQLLPIIDAYRDLLDKRQGKVDVDVTVASPLSDDELEQVRQAVSKALNKTAVVHQRVDDSIIGGLVVRVEDKILDASVRSQLEAMRRKLLTATA